MRGDVAHAIAVEMARHSAAVLKRGMTAVGRMPGVLIRRQSLRRRVLCNTKRMHVPPGAHDQPKFLVSCWWFRRLTTVL